MGGEQERGSQALDLERPAELALHRVPEAFRRDQREGKEDDRDDRREGAERDRRLPAAATLRQVDEQRWQEDERVDLRRGREAEDGEPEPVAARQHRSERACRQRGRPQVVAGEHDRAEGEREEPDPDRDRQHAGGRRSLDGDPAHGQDENGRGAGPHEQLEERAIVLGRAEGREPEDGQSRRRVLELEVAVGHLARRHRLAVFLVHGRVDDLVAVERRKVEGAPGRRQEAEADGQGEENEPDVSGSGRALRPDAHRPNPPAPVAAPPFAPRWARGGRTRRRGRTTGCRDRTSASARARSR